MKKKFMYFRHDTPYSALDKKGRASHLESHKKNALTF